MTKKHHSSFYSFYKKNEEILSLTSSAEKDSLFFGSCIAISPDSQQIVTFDPETYEFKLYKVDDLSSSERIFTLKCGVNDKHLCWSIAISNCIDDENERFIALSCSDARGFRNDIMYGDEENDLKSNDKVKNKNDLESGDKVNNQYGDDGSYSESCDKYLRPRTWVISTTDRSEISTSLESIGGVIKFLDSDDGNYGDDSDQPLKNKPIIIIIVNAFGIYKETMNHTKRKQVFFSRPPKIKQFELPEQLSIRISRDHWQNSFELLHTSIIKNHFIVHSFENRQQIIEMYSLITGDLEMLFKRHESSLAPNIIRGPPIYAISQNEKILAFCRGTTSITLYFMENGLEITTKQLESQRIYKIIAINFIDDDSKLLIVIEEKEDRQGENSKHQIFVVWDLFTTFENSIRQIDYSEPLKPLKMDVTHKLMNSHGNMFAVRDSGDIFSVLDHPDVALIRNPPANAITEIDITTKDHVYHKIYNMDGERFDTSKNQIIINNVEPWHLKDSYFRISVYLDPTESTQLIISSNTIQVWKYRTVEKWDRVLEYIWARKKAMDVQELRIGEREFMLKVSIPSTKRFAPPKSMTIHWPNNVNVLEGACRALYVLSEKKHIVAGHENVNKIKYLVECTQRLVRKYITKYGIFRLTSIRYPIMKYLIKSYQDSLIKHILNKKINSKNSNIYIPRLYKWASKDNNKSTTEISKSDLHHSILCIKKRGDPTVILKYLIDYYSDNAKEYNNYGWMFTVSKSIPLLYDFQLREFVQYLFKKPCFGITEAYTPPLHINPYDQKKGNNAAVIHSLVVKPRLASKFNNNLRFFLENLFTRFRTSRTDRKVYIVPLPDFTVYPNPKGHESFSKYFWFLFTFFRIFFWPRRKVINNTKEMSPFLRVIHEEKEKGYKIYQTPTIMAVLDFKWSAVRRYFIHSNIIFTISLFVYLYTGWYLIVTEIVQLKREGWYRYINIYNMFDLGSVLFPLADNIVIILHDYQVLIFPYSIFNPVLAFTALFMWLELDFDKPFRFENYYSDFISSVESVFFWSSGRWNQLDQWDSYTVDVISILGSLILVLIFQNMLIAFMNGAFDKASEESRTATHRYRAELVVEYEALEKPFHSKRGNPRYIYYIPDPDVIDTWLMETKKVNKQKSRLVGENLADLTDLTDFENSDDDKNQDNSSYSKKHRLIQNEDSSSTMGLDIEPATTKYNGTIDKISFIDEEILEIFMLKDITSKLSKKLNNKSLKNVSYDTKNCKSSSEPSSEDHRGPTTNADGQERFNNLEKQFKTNFNNLETRFNNLEKRLEQNLETILKTLNNLNNSK
ncbi:685_t:CDS:2 [Diversispora eburnea]|uniref:685_t:CDS:1 n=1 Tax=Diversispora eburnea TaxID=1213867 RepID=A0A9N9FP56_9GLOM|nr:685_t:CDS:2 [Diversispora eburnea]